VKLHELVKTCALAAESGDAMGAVRQVLEDLKNRLAELEEVLAHISGIGGNARQIFYRSPGLAMLKVCFPSGRRTPPHDHGTWASILLLSGEEKNTLYRRENGGLRKASEVRLQRGSILCMRPDTVHVAECVGAQPTIGLHVYGGDLLELPRRMWNPETLEEHPLDWALYDAFARTASRAAGAPDPAAAH